LLLPKRGFSGPLGCNHYIQFLHCRLHPLDRTNGYRNTLLLVLEMALFGSLGVKFRIMDQIPCLSCVRLLRSSLYRLCHRPTLLAMMQPQSLWWLFTSAMYTAQGSSTLRCSNSHHLRPRFREKYCTHKLPPTHRAVQPPIANYLPYQVTLWSTPKFWP
jgi:hypothetical protein